MAKYFVILSLLLVAYIFIHEYNKASAINSIYVLPNKQNTYDPFKINEEFVKNFILPLQECWDRDCEITYNSGGVVRAFVESAKKAKEGKHIIAITGTCISACTGFANLLHDQVCIGPYTRFLYHTDNDNQIPGYFDSWTLDKVVSYGGFPKYETNKLVELTYDDLKNHWKTCTQKELYRVAYAEMKR